MKPRKMIGLILIGSMLGQFTASTSRAAGTPIVIPAELSEGTETELTDEQIAEILPWARNAEITLKGLLEGVRNVPSGIQHDYLLHGIQRTVLASAPVETELLMRYILNRAILIDDLISKEADVRVPGVRAQQIKLLKRSIELALKYYESDLAYLNDRFENKGNGSDLDPPYARFALEYAEFLMVIDNSMLDASAQYKVGLYVLKLLRWDLYRDSDRAAYAPAIDRLTQSLAGLPDQGFEKDSQHVLGTRLVKLGYQAARGFAIDVFNQIQARVEAKAKAERDIIEAKERAEREAVEARERATREAAEAERQRAEAARAEAERNAKAQAEAAERARAEESAKAKEEQFRKIRRFESTKENPDGSITITEPRILWGSHTYPIAGGSNEAACRLFGYGQFLESYYASEDVTATLEWDGSFFKATSGEWNRIRTLTCYRQGSLRIAKGAERQSSNPDGSVTITKPRLLWGSRSYPIAGTSTQEACRLFGYRQFLESDYAVEKETVILAEDGSFSEESSGKWNRIETLTCK